MPSEQGLKSEVARLGATQPWWHDIELPHGVHTINRKPGEEGRNSDAVKWQRISTLLDYRGKRVIDVPCNDGYYCVRLLEAGAKTVLAMDIDAGRIEKSTFIKNTLGLEDMDVRQGSVYDLPQSLTDKYDIALCLGLLHRVPDPYGLMETMLQTAETIVIEWPALLTQRADARFWGGEAKQDFYNTGYWELSRVALTHVLTRLGARYIIDCDPYAKRAIFVVTSSQEISRQVRSNMVRPSRRDWLDFKVRCWREALSTLATNVGLRRTGSPPETMP